MLGIFDIKQHWHQAFHSDDATASGKEVGAFHLDDATAIAESKQSGAAPYAGHDIARVHCGTVREHIQTVPKYITEEIKRYEPCDEDIFISIPNGEYQRLVWAEPLELRERETEFWEKFMEYIKENELEALPENFMDFRRIGFRYLQGCGWKNEVAYSEIFQHKQWREETFPIDASQCIPVLQQGALYCPGRCKVGNQPIIVMNIFKFTQICPDNVERQRISCFFLDWIIEYMMDPGHVESWFMITDFEGCGLSQIPGNSLQEIASEMERNFRGRLFRNCMVNTHWLISGLWSSVKGWVDPFVQQKITIVSNKDDMKNLLLQYVDENVLEEKYGGVRPNIEGEFFPPKIIEN